MALTIEHLHDLLAPGAEALGYELIAVEMSGGDHSVLRVYIDAENGVSVEDCATASHQFSAILDVEDPINTRYTLEVSSPGLDRPLVKPAHFKAHIGERVKIKMTSLVDGRRRFTGTLVAANDDSAVVEFDGIEADLPYRDMDKARVIPVFE